MVAPSPRVSTLVAVPGGVRRVPRPAARRDRPSPRRYHRGGRRRPSRCSARRDRSAPRRWTWWPPSRDRFERRRPGRRRSRSTAVAPGPAELRPGRALADASLAAELRDLLPAGHRGAGRARRPGRRGRRGRRDGQRRGRASPASPSRWPRCRAGKRLALANKESLIAGAPVVQPPGAPRAPASSRSTREHCAIHQCLRAGAGHAAGWPQAGAARPAADRSGGGAPAELAAVTIDDALAHPTWSMGPKITVDSSTLMNKGLEVIEAHELFDVGLRPDRRRRAPPVDRALHGRPSPTAPPSPSCRCPTCGCRSATP